MQLMTESQVPLVSIVLLTKNAGDWFKKTLEMIFAQEADFLFEVIAVDSGSTDETLELLRSYPVRIYQIKPSEFSFGPTRDFAFAQAKGEYIATISQDVIPQKKDWLKNLVKPLINNEADLVQGQLTVSKEKRHFFWERNAMFYFTSDGKEFCRRHGGLGLSCTNLAIKRSAWEKTKFGPAAMSEDKMLQKRLFEQGYRILKEKQALGCHGHVYNLRTLIKRCENEGFGWRCTGVKYTFRQMFRDLFPKKWQLVEMKNGIRAGEINNLASLLFIFIRPIFLYKGNLVNRRYKFPD